MNTVCQNFGASLLYFVVRVGCRRKRFTFAISSPDEVLVNFGGSYVCANFGENLSKMRPKVPTDGYTDTLTD